MTKGELLQSLLDWSDSEIIDYRNHLERQEDMPEFIKEEKLSSYTTYSVVLRTEIKRLFAEEGGN